MRRLAGRPALLALVGGLVVARLAWHPGGAICGQMTVTGCLGVAVLVVAVLGLAAWIVRATWLAVGAARAVAALARLPSPQPLVAAAQRSGVGEVICLDEPASSAFCAGLLRPRVFLTSGTVASLADEELAAVLVHEAEHAHRRDPLRRLVGRAAADVLFWLPLVGWWSRRFAGCRPASVNATITAGWPIASTGSRPRDQGRACGSWYAGVSGRRRPAPASQRASAITSRSWTCARAW